MIAKRMRNKETKSEGIILAETTRDGVEWVWFQADHLDYPCSDYGYRYEPIPVAVPKIGEFWGYYHTGGMKWIVIAVNEEEGWWALADTGEYIQPEAPVTRELGVSFKGYYRLLPETRMVKREQQS